MASQQAVAGTQCSTCQGAFSAAQRLRPLCRSAPSIHLTQHRRQGNGVRRRTTSVIAQAKQVKREQEASASAQESAQAEQEGQTDNVATPVQEQLPNQQEVTMKMSQEDLASLKDAIRKQKGGGGADDSSFVEGILEEVKLITWPNPLQALSDTVVVISIVLGSAVTLFFVNTILADLSKLLYKL